MSTEINTSTFFKYFNLIKPRLDEIVETAGIEIAEEIFNDYNLQIIKNDHYDDAVISLIENTNLSNLYFSPFLFSNSISNDLITQIAVIAEKGRLLFNRITKKILFQPDDSDETDGEIDQQNFIKFFLWYSEFDFNRVYRWGAKATITNDIIEDFKVFFEFSVFNDLFNEIKSN
jgi:hypothetical protein